MYLAIFCMVVAFVAWATADKILNNFCEKPTALKEFLLGGCIFTIILVLHIVAKK